MHDSHKRDPLEHLRAPDGTIDLNVTGAPAVPEPCALCGAGDSAGCECARPGSVTIAIDLTAAPFADPDIPDAQMRAELARCLRSLADEVHRGVGPITDLDVKAGGERVGGLTVDTGDPWGPKVSLENVASFCALMQGGGGIITKSPQYLHEKFSLLLADNAQELDPTRAVALEQWRERWMR